MGLCERAVNLRILALGDNGSFRGTLYMTVTPFIPAYYVRKAIESFVNRFNAVVVKTR